MNKTHSAINTLKKTSWFCIESWKFITTKSIVSKLEYFIYLIPAWYRFSLATYKDYRNLIE